ncbi:MAG: HNH endonuclease, partial [Pirellulales bacterium]
LQAYYYKCAVCDCDLKLVDAAHIVPISHPTSTDDVTNGLALCRLHHGAYDNALLGVQSDYQIVINPERSERLHEIGMDSWLPVFTTALPQRIRVPASIEVRPFPENLRLGLELRRWPGRLIA